MTAIARLVSRLDELKRARNGALQTVAHVALVGIAVCAVTSILVVTLAQVDPITVATAFYQGSLGSVYALTSTAAQATPIVFIAIGTSLALRAGVFNVGGNGQMAIGALGAFAVMAALSSLPGLLVWPLAAVSGALAGLLWAVVPALLYLRRGVNDILTTLLMNYIGLGIVTWLTGPTWAYHDPSTIVNQSSPIARQLELPELAPGTTLDAGILVALIALLAAAWYVGTRQGFLDEIQGANPRLAQLAGVSVGRNRTLLLLLSAGVAGVAGFVQLAGADHFLASGVVGSAGGAGYTGLLAAVLGRGRPLPSALVALLFAVLLQSSNTLQGVGVPQPLVEVIEGLLVIGGALPRLVQFRVSITE